MSFTPAKKLALFIGFWVISLLAAAAIAPNYIQQTLFIGSRNLFGERLPRLVWVWANLDGNHYLSIARDGYYQYEHGFFPLYPWFIRAVSAATKQPFLISGLAVTYSAFFGFLILMWKLLRLDGSPRNAFSTLLWFLTFPTSFFLISVYNDSLYLFLAVASWYFARTGRVGLAGFFGYFAALSRITGLALLPGLVVEGMLQRKRPGELWPLILVPLGTVTYLVYLQLVEGSFRLLGESMKVWQQHRFVFPLQTLWRYTKILTGFRELDRAYLVAGIEAFVVLLSLFLLLRGWKLVRRSYAVYAAVVLLLPASSGTLQGMPRYFLHAFPLVFILSALVRRSPYQLPFRILCVLLQMILFAYFSQGHFVS